MTTLSRIVLASKSPWRLDVLRKARIPVVAIPSEADESAVVTQDGAAQALGRAEIKAVAVSAQHRDSLVIGADQVLSLGSRNFDKARDPAEADEHLAALSGRTHILHSAFVLAVGGRVVHQENVPVSMRMRQLSSGERAAYLATGEWQGSVGCYKIEGAGAQLFDGPIGDYFAIIGMPIAEVTRALRALGLDLISNPTGPWVVSSPR